MYKEVKGNLITMALSGEFDVIAHGCNCQCQMGAGIAPQMAAHFFCDSYPLEHKDYKGDVNKLGQIDYKTLVIIKDRGIVFDAPAWRGHRLSVVNAYSQYGFGRNHEGGDKYPLDYEALTLCLRKINHIFKGKHVGLPQIGAGLAKGLWVIIRDIIKDELKDCDVTVVIYNEQK